MNESEFLQGLAAFERHEECPQSASELFQRGYGMAYAAAEAQPPIDLRKELNRIFKEPT